MPSCTLLFGVVSPSLESCSMELENLAMNAGRCKIGCTLIRDHSACVMCSLLSQQVSALGHSAGAHMWAMVLLERAKAAGRKVTQTSLNGTREASGQPDTRMPARFIGGRLPVKWHLLKPHNLSQGAEDVNRLSRRMQLIDMRQECSVQPTTWPSVWRVSFPTAAHISHVCCCLGFYRI